MALRIENEKGSALVLVLFFILTFTVIGIGVMVSSTTNSTMSLNFEIVTQAKHLSDIGLTIALREFINSGYLKTTHTEDMDDVLSGDDRLSTDVENISIDSFGDYVWDWEENSDYDPLVDLADKTHGFSFRVYFSSANNFVIESDGWYGPTHQLSKARGRIESMFEFSHLSAGDMGDFTDGSDQEVRGKIHANGDIYLRPEGSDLTINPLYFSTAGDIIRSRDAWGRPDDLGYGSIQIIQKKQDSGDLITMDPGSPRGEEGTAFDSYHIDWESNNDGAQKLWGGIVRDRVSRKYFPPITNFQEGGYYDLAAQDGGLVIDNTSHYESWCTQISDYYNTVEDRTQTLWEIDLQTLSDNDAWPGNGLMYCTVPVRLVNAESFEDNLMVASCRNVYTYGNFNAGNSEDVIAGALNINPSNSSKNIFVMQTPSGEIDRNSLHSNGSGYTYSGEASEVKIKAKAHGRTIGINGQDVELSPNTRYTFSGSLSVNLWNEHSGDNWGQANGHWWIDINGNDITINPSPSGVDDDDGDDGDGGAVKSAAIMTSHRIYHLTGPVEAGDAIGENPIDGDLNINPSNSSGNKFIMQTPSGQIDIDTLETDGSGFTYAGEASEVKIKVKSQGRTLYVNGQPIELSPSSRYTMTGSLDVNVYNAHGGSGPPANGHWWIGISGADLTFDPAVDFGDDDDDDVTSGVRINAALVDGAPAVDEYNWVDRDGNHRYDYDNSVIYDDWDAKTSMSFNSPYNSGNPGANTSNLLDDWAGMTLTITGSIIHLGSNYNYMADNLDNSEITDDQIAWIRQTNSGSGARTVIYNQDLGTAEGEPPFTPRIGQITNWGR